MKYALLAIYLYMSLVTYQFIATAQERGIVMPTWKYAALVAFWPAFYAPIAVRWDYDN